MAKKLISYDDTKPGLGLPDVVETALNTAYGRSAQMARRSEFSDRLLTGAGGWFVQRRNEDEHRMVRDLGSGYYSDYIVRLPQVHTTPGPESYEGRKRAVCFTDMFIGQPMVTETLDRAEWTGTWFGQPLYLSGKLPHFTDGVDPYVVTETVTAGNTYITLSDPLPGGGVRWHQRRLVIEGAGEGGEDLVATLANLANGGTRIVLSTSVKTSVDNAIVRIWPKRQYTSGSDTSDHAVSYTTPVPSDRLGVVHSLAGSGGLFAVSIDGDLTRANCLPTAQDIVDEGLAGADILVGNGGTLAPYTRVLDFYRSGEILTVWQAVATGLDPTVPHTMTISGTGQRRTSSVSTIALIAAFSYGTPDMTPLTPGAYVHCTHRVSTHFPTHELAIDHKPDGASGKVFVGGNNHGYEFELAPPRLVADGEVLSLGDGDSRAVAGSASLSVVADMYHPEVMDDPTFAVERTYRADQGGLSVRQVVTAERSTDIDSGYLAMFSVDQGMDRVQVDRLPDEFDLTDLDANPYQSYVGAGENTAAAWWDSDGEVMAAIVVPTAEQATHGWSDGSVKFGIRQMTGSKMYLRYKGILSPGEVLACEATYLINRAPDGAARHFPVK